MWAEYIKEREGFETVQTENGFATFFIKDEQCYIKDIYVKPEHRKSRLASQMADEVTRRAKEAGCTMLTGSVSLQTGDPTCSIKVLFGYGFKVDGYQHNLLWFVKKI